MKEIMNKRKGTIKGSELFNKLPKEIQRGIKRVLSSL